MAVQDMKKKMQEARPKDFQDFKDKVHEVKPNQWFLFASCFLVLLAMFFSIGGLADVWWAGTYEMQMGRIKIVVAYASTLWENTILAGSTAQAATIDDHCGQSALPEEDQANCDKIRGIRAFVFLMFFSVLAALACQVARIVPQSRHQGDESSLVEKHLSTAAIACKIFASFCAFVATCIAPSLEFKQIGNGAIDAAGAGYVLTILLMIFCLWPAIVLECIVWKRTYWFTSETKVETIGSGAVSNLPTLVGSTIAAKSNSSSSPNPPDLEANATAPK